jgi:hypothetical protein
MNIECHFIPHTFHYVSVYFVLNNTSLRCCSPLRTHSSNLAHRSPSARLAMFSGISEICFRIAILRSSMVRGLVVYTFALMYPQRKWSQRDQENVQAMETHSALKWHTPETLPERSRRMLSLYGQLHHLAGDHMVENSVPRRLSSGVKKFHNIST